MVSTANASSQWPSSLPALAGRTRSPRFAPAACSRCASAEVPLREGSPLMYRYAVVIADGGVDAERAQRLADAAQAALNSWA